MGLAIKQQVIDNYYLIATDIDEDLSLSYCDPSDKSGCVGIIIPTVFAVGYNKDYIIVQQHPRVFPDPPNKRITNYFILPVNYKSKRWGDNFGLVGPLTSEEFNKKRKELGIPDSLKFTIVRDNLK
jgi:hypothetical protein